MPAKVFVVLHASIVALGKDEGKKASPATIRRWLALLVKRSLFLELTRGSISLHDVRTAMIEYTQQML